jgi:hypothetical protein
MPEHEEAENPQLVGWIAENQNLAISFASVLLVLYVAPIFLALLSWCLTDGFLEESRFLEWFAALMGSSEATLNQYHKVLLPFLTTLSVVAFRGAPSRGVVLLGAFLLLSFAVTLVVSVIFDMQSTVAAFDGLQTRVDPALTKAFFTRVQESLLNYFMLLFGLGVASKIR